jgi:hypothetical protein
VAIQCRTLVKQIAQNQDSPRPTETTGPPRQALDSSLKDAIYFNQIVKDPTSHTTVAVSTRPSAWTGVALNQPSPESDPRPPLAKLPD